jgi:tol-pal system protein YbgF
MTAARAASLGLLVAVALMTGCATKSDIDDLGGQLRAVRATQDSLARRLAAVERSLMEELASQGSMLTEFRGSQMRTLDNIERQLVQIQELLGQSQVVLRGLRERAGQREPERATVTGPDTTNADTARAGAAEGGDGAAETLYRAAMEQFRRGAFSTARTGFEQFLIDYPAHELAPQAQYHLAETFREAGEPEEAIRQYNRVVELYPNSQAAPTALYKAGLIQVERGNKELGCEYFQRVLAGYPRSDDARVARDQSERLNCR